MNEKTQMRNKFVSVVVDGNLSKWTGPNPTIDESAMTKAVETAVLLSTEAICAYPVLVTQILEDDTVSSLSGIVKREGYIVTLQSGTGSCWSDRAVLGVFETAEAAADRAKDLRKSNRKGYIWTRKVQYERLPDGRVIIGPRVFEDDCFYQSGESAYYDLALEGESIQSF